MDDGLVGCDGSALRHVCLGHVGGDGSALRLQHVEVGECDVRTKVHTVGGRVRHGVVLIVCRGGREQRRALLIIKGFAYAYLLQGGAKANLYIIWKKLC